MLVHLETRVQTVFALVEDGNVTKKWVVQPDPNQADPLQIQVLSEESFKRAYEAIVGLKAQLVAQLENPPQELLK
jgi:hypothetical protein